MSEMKKELMAPRTEKEKGDNTTLELPENKTEVLGGTIETHLNALLVKHVETAKALK